MRIFIRAILAATVLAGFTALPARTSPQSPGSYQPKFAGDKAHSSTEAAALGYMRTAVSAQKVYKQKHGTYANSLSALVGSGSFTRRMAGNDRGDYTVAFRSKTNGYSLALTPKQFDPEHRAFYVDESGVFHAEESKPANSSSPALN
jgi:hypothetical protein